MRLENSARNVKTAWLWQLVHILCQFLSRTVIIKVLSIEYVGLSGLFSNVLTMLSLAELGIGEAIIFSLYGPIARGEERTLTAVMAFYRKIYIAVGVFILFAGTALTPWIDHLVKEVPDIPQFHLIYVLYVLNTSVSYFFSYRAAYVTANQHNHLVVLNNGLWEIGMVLLQIAVLFGFRNYIAYMVIGIVFVLLQNLSISHIAKQKYPLLAKHAAEPIPREVFSEIKRNTAAMVFHKIGMVMVFATDNLIISKFIGLISVGLYANYCTITNAVTTFIGKFFQAIAASVGNLAAEEDIERQENTFFKVLFVNFWLYTFSCCCLFNLLNPFIRDVWLGDEYIFGTWIVLLLVVKIYVSGMRSAVQTFKNAKGLYWQNRYMPIYESVINLAASLFLVRYLGVAGVLLGTIISSLCTCVWIEPHVLYKYGFHKSAGPYIRRYLQYLLVFAAVMVLTYLSNRCLPVDGLPGFLLKCIWHALLPNFLLLALYGRSEEFRYFSAILRRRRNRSA